MKKASLLHTDFDKSCLHAGQDAGNFTFIEISRYAPFLFSFNEEFREEAVLHNGNTALLRRGVNKNFSFHKNRFRAHIWKEEWSWRETGHRATSEIPQRPFGTHFIE